jgi:hypothetical protein
MKFSKLFLIIPIWNKNNFNTEKLSIINTKYMYYNKNFNIDLKIIGKTKSNIDSKVFLQIYPNYEIKYISIKNKYTNSNETLLNLNIYCLKDDDPYYELPLGYFFDKNIKSKKIDYK